MVVYGIKRGVQIRRPSRSWCYADRAFRDVCDISSSSHGSKKEKVCSN